ncbi:alpha-N-arabinofuranosidase [Horticoccus luteus]|uniref:non-reducing end alpha-L-arabinofuranosidase n=1 Tax=Horticoccus luteus TaxID=2862869 RepID=A0A8F9TW82_9BACT|nr:alpha-L-arabinofuranosidase C-terminal domain-containing protein [Horticoccus luteus]QYM79265.1 alpha-N-arabinofuranosidase [Horticoccus luteus]
MPRANLTIRANEPGPTISRHLFGHFAEHLGRCIYDGLWVGENARVPHVRGWRSDLVAALRRLRIPNLRWPGGCFADDYAWRDGIGPRERRPRRINAHWGGVVDDNAVGTHEFLDLCAQLGCEPYVAANVGSGSPREMRDWIEYCNAPAGSLAEERAANGRREPWKIRLWGIGNENWGCGGHMTPEYYANEYRRFTGYAREFPDAPLFRVACGPAGDDVRWTEVMMRDALKGPFHAAPMFQGLSLHYYTMPGTWENKHAASPFDENGWKSVMALGWKMDAIVRGHRAVMDRYDAAGAVALVVDEWGAWFAAEPGTNPGFLYQQQTVRDAVLAALTLNVFINHCERVRFANLAQIVNVLQAVALTEPGGGRLVLTPTWDTLELYSAHQDARRLAVDCDAAFASHDGLEFPHVSATASVAADESITLTVCNTDPAAAADVTLALAGRNVSVREARVLATPVLTTCNTFDHPRAVTARPLDGVKTDAAGVHFTLPPGAVAALRFS